MKKILVLSHYFYPANSVVSPRIQSWADEFTKHGLFPVIVTRHWTGNEKSWSEFLQDNTKPIKHVTNSSYELYFLPYVSFKNNLLKIIWKNKFLRKIAVVTNAVIGNYTLEANSRKCFSEFTDALLRKEKFDAVLVSSPPINIVKLGYELSKKYSVPLIVDLRDIWNNSITNKAIKLSVKDKIYLYLQKMHIAIWLKRAKLVTTVSEPLMNEVKGVFKGKTQVITNGYEERIFSKLNLIKPSQEKFHCSVVGTVYPVQDISVFIEGMKLFFKRADSTKVQLNFIGIESVPAVAEKIGMQFENFPVKITNKIERAEALQYMVQSHVLFYMGWKGYKGIYSAKIFEYLGAARNIIIAPGDDDVLDALVTSCNAGKIANTPQEFAEHLFQFYNEWLNTKEVKYNGKEAEIKKYSREKQAQIFAEQILSVL